jgi:hypothetical protein
MEDQEPRGMRVHDLTNSDQVPVEVQLVVTNTGEAAARNVNIDFIPAPSPEDTNWLVYHSKEFVEGDMQDASQDSADRSYQATLSEDSKIRINYKISISPSLYLQYKTSNPSITFFVTYDDHEEEINQYRVCFDDCLERLGWMAQTDSAQAIEDQYDPNKGEPTEETTEDIQRAQNEIAIQEELDRIDEKERVTVALVMADDRVKEHIKDALQVDSNFVPSEQRQNTDMDKVTLTVTGEETLEGSWETSYTSKLTGMFTLEIEVRNGTIMSIEKKPSPDLGGKYTYTDAEKEMIRTALQDPAVQTALKEKEDAGKTVAITIRSQQLDFPAYNCPMNQCALIFLREVNSHATLEVWLNTAEGKVVMTKQADGW